MAAASREFQWYQGGVNVDQSDWACIRLAGDDRVRFLHNMCTANVEKLGDGGWTRASILNVKGRVVSVIDIVARPDALLVVCEPALGDKTLEVLRKHAIMDDVELELVRGPMHRVWPTPGQVWSAQPVFAPCPEPVASTEQAEIRRIEAGLPRYGVEVDEDCFPFESGLVAYIDYDKGCYLGQEPVSRVKHRGQANRRLMAVRVVGDGPVAPGSVIAHAERAEAGTVLSSVEMEKR